MVPEPQDEIQKAPFGSGAEERVVPVYLQAPPGEPLNRSFVQRPSLHPVELLNEWSTRLATRRSLAAL